MYKIRFADGREYGPAPMATLVEWARQGRVPLDALVAPAEGGEARSVLAEPALRAVLQSPPVVQGPIVQPQADEPLAAIIPYKNPPALIGYYTAIVSLIPLVGAIAGPVAIILGIVGVRRRLREPRLRGLAHAWIAIVGGVIGCLISFGCILPAILSAAMRGR